MKTDQAILAFSQSEKIKGGLIWLSQTLELLQGFHGAERKGSETTVNHMLHMVAHETDVARTITGHEIWGEIAAHIDRAAGMVSSGVGHEATVHLSRALSQVTNVALEAMTTLKERGLL